MRRLEGIRQWIHEERKYVWILVFLILFHSMVVLVGSFALPLPGPESVPGEEIFEEAKLMETFRKDPLIQFLFGIGTLAFLFLMVAGFILGLQFVMLKRQGRFVIPWRSPEQEIRWSLRDVFHVVVLIIFASYVIELIQAFFFHFSGGKGTEGVHLIGGTLLLDLLAVYLILRVVTAQKGQGVSSLGLSTNAFPQNVLFGLRGYFSLLPVLLLAFFLSLWLAELFRFSPPKQPLQHLFLEESSREILALALILVVILGPIVEEIFFRGFLYNALKVRWGRGRAILSSGFFFAVLHANLVGFLPIILLGCALAYGYELTGSLVTSMTIHIVHNALVMAVFYFSIHLSQLFGVGG